MEFINTGECIQGCWGVALGHEIDPGDTRYGYYSAMGLLLYTGAFGSYRIAVFELGTGVPPQPPHPQVVFELSDGTPNTAVSRGAIKSGYIH